MQKARYPNFHVLLSIKEKRGVQIACPALSINIQAVETVTEHRFLSAVGFVVITLSTGVVFAAVTGAGLLAERKKSE